MNADRNPRRPLAAAHRYRSQQAAARAPLATRGPRVVVLLTADTGGGHRATAEAVRQALEVRLGGRFASVSCDPSGPVRVAGAGERRPVVDDRRRSRSCSGGEIRVRVPRDVQVPQVRQLEAVVRAHGHTPASCCYYPLEHAVL